jgi:UTP-glucose-1-phosphate uridylyltransferase
MNCRSVLSTCLDGFELPEDREKPWGTGHAILVAQDVIDEPFAVINADDYYGINAFKGMADFLSGKEVSPSLYSMVGFVLRNTLSEYGTVARGVCECDDKMFMKKVVERTKRSSIFLRLSILLYRTAKQRSRCCRLMIRGLE